MNASTTVAASLPAAFCGKKLRSPRWRPPRTIASVTHHVDSRSIATIMSTSPAVESDLRIPVPGDEDVAVALVVAEKHVVARRETLGEIVLHQERLGLGAGRRHFRSRHLCQHQRRARDLFGLLEIRRDPLPQV